MLHRGWVQFRYWGGCFDQDPDCNRRRKKFAIRGDDVVGGSTKQGGPFRGTMLPQENCRVLPGLCQGSARKLGQIDRRRQPWLSEALCSHAASDPGGQLANIREVRRVAERACRQAQE